MSGVKVMRHSNINADLVDCRSWRCSVLIEFHTGMAANEPGTIGIKPAIKYIKTNKKCSKA